MANTELIAVLNVISGAVALLISYYAYRANRLVGSILLRYISIGFLILGMSLILQAGTERLVGAIPIDVARERGIKLVAIITYTALEVVAYGLFAWGYGLSAFARKQTPAGAPVPALAGTGAGRLLASAVLVLTIYVASQVAVIFLLLLIVIQGVRVFTHSKSNLALIVLFGFTLIFAGHLLMLTGVLGSLSGVFLVGNSIEFCGFLALLIFLVWSGRSVK